MQSTPLQVERRFSLSSILPPFDPQEPAKVVTVLDHTSHRRRRLNQYVRGVKIGKGKHGDVYICRDETKPDGCDLAVKVIPRSNPRDKIKLLRKSARQHSQIGVPPMSSTTNNIRKELAIMKVCRHPNVVRLVEIIDDPGEDKIYMIMDYLSGGPVEWSDEEKKPLLTLPQTRRIMRDAILGLEYLHHEGVIHRDIKPANILYNEDRSSVKIIDFGVAHYTPPSRPTVSKQVECGPPLDYPIDPTLFPETDLLKRVGTPSFLAPEVVWFEDVQSEASSSPIHTKIPKVNQRPQITKAIDVWSLGVTFYCFLFGHTPFNVPSSANDNVHHNEFVLYQQISKSTYAVDDFMGAERVPTAASRPSGGNATTEGSTGVQLLDQMLEKDPKRRINLSEIKRKPWILRDIHDPDEWLKSTSPECGSRGEEVKSLGQKLRNLLLGAR